MPVGVCNSLNEIFAYKIVKDVNRPECQLESSNTTGSYVENDQAIDCRLPTGGTNQKSRTLQPGIACYI